MTSHVRLLWSVSRLVGRSVMISLKSGRYTSMMLLSEHLFITKFKFFSLSTITKKSNYFWNSPNKYIGILISTSSQANFKKMPFIQAKSVEVMNDIQLHFLLPSSAIVFMYFMTFAQEAFA